MGNRPYKETPEFLGDDGFYNQKSYLKWHFENNLGPNPFKTVSKEYIKDNSKCQELFLELDLYWPNEESEVPAFFDNLDLEQVNALLELIKDE